MKTTLGGRDWARSIAAALPARKARRESGITGIVSRAETKHRTATVLALEPDRQCADALAGGGEDGVRHRRGDARCAGLADAARRRVAGDDVQFNVRHLVDAQHVVVVEVALLHAAAVDRDAAFQRGAEAERDRALDLLLDDRRIHGAPAIDGTNHPMRSEEHTSELQSRLHLVCRLL